MRADPPPSAPMTARISKPLTTRRARAGRRVAYQIISARHAADLIVMTTPPDRLDQIMRAYAIGLVNVDRAHRRVRISQVGLYLAVGVNVGAALVNLTT